MENILLFPNSDIRFRKKEHHDGKMGWDGIEVRYIRRNMDIIRTLNDHTFRYPSREAINE